MSNDESGFRIERSSDGVSFAQVGTISANAVSFTNAGLTTNSAYSGTVTIATLPPPFTAVALSATSVQLNWTDNATGEHGFKVERSADGVTWVQVATLGPNTVTWTNTGLKNKMTYYYRVRAYEGSLNGPYSAVVPVTTP